MTMDAQNNLVPLRDQIQDFLYAAIVRAIHQAAKMEAAMELHQERMKDVCWYGFDRLFNLLPSQANKFLTIFIGSFTVAKTLPPVSIEFTSQSVFSKITLQKVSLSEL